MSSPLLFSRVGKFAKVVLGLLLPAVVFSQVSPSVQTSANVSRVDIASDIKVVTPVTGRIGSVDMQSARVGAETVTVQRGDFVVTLLANNGIRQDTESLGLVYDLNPQIDDIRKIRAGQTLVVPSIEGSRSLESALRKGYRVELVRNTEVAQVVNGRSQEFQVLEATVDGLPMDRFDSGTVKTEVTDLLSETRKALNAFMSPNNIVSQSVLQQVTADAGFILKTVTTSVSSERTISTSDLAQIKLSVENLAAMSQEVSSGGSGLVLTKINTILESTGEPVKELKVFYAPKGDSSLKRECSGLSTPLTEAIPRGNYVFWAMRGDQKVSQDKEREIRKATREIALDIQIIR